MQSTMAAIKERGVKYWLAPDLMSSAPLARLPEWCPTGRWSVLLAAGPYRVDGLTSGLEPLATHAVASD